MFPYLVEKYTVIYLDTQPGIASTALDVKQCYKQERYEQQLEFIQGQLNMIDADGYRPNVGMVVCNREGKLLWAKRVDQSGWQFPQGGVQAGESLKQALYRELDEELGLRAKHVEFLHQSQDWLHYQFPQKYIAHNSDPTYKGQKQVWFLLGLIAAEEKINLARSNSPEFEDWCWVDYWYPVDKVVEFKRDVYRTALQEMRTPLEHYIRQQ